MENEVVFQHVGIQMNVVIINSKKTDNKKEILYNNIDEEYKYNVQEKINYNEI